MYCPRCSIQAVEGQRFCKNCGMNLGVILDAFEGKQRGQLDFETLKRDLRELGSNLRSGFEEASSAIKKTQRLDKQKAQAGPVGGWQMPNWSHEFNKALRRFKVAHSRKYSLQQATLSLFGGGALCYAWYLLLKNAASSGLIESIEQTIFMQTGAQIEGLGRVIASLWVLGLIPVARGVAHLINGVFFAPKQIEETEQQVYIAPVYGAQPFVAATPELEVESQMRSQQASVTEDSTLRFEPREVK